MQTDSPAAVGATFVPAWPRSIAQGLEILLGAWLLDVMGLRWQYKLGGPDWLWELLGLIPTVLELIGFWMVTTPAADAVVSGGGHVARWITRWVAVVLAVGSLLDTTCIVSGLWAEGAALVFTLPVVAMHMAVFAVYLGCLAKSEGRPGFVWQTYVALGGLAAGLLAFAVSVRLLAVEPPLEAPPQLATLAPMLGSILALLVFGIWSLVLVWHYKKLLSAPPAAQATAEG